MAKVALKWLVWVSDPKVDSNGVPLRNEIGEFVHDRVEIQMDHVVPDTVPIEVQLEWERRDPPLVFEDPTKDHIEQQEGPPRVTLPPILTQRLEHGMTPPARRVPGRGIPPRPASKE